jgi:hypothetical protein
MTMEGPGAPPYEAGQLYTLRFSVTDAAGKPARLQPYMGMIAHAAIIRSDGQEDLIGRLGRTGNENRIADGRILTAAFDGEVN